MCKCKDKNKIEPIPTIKVNDTIEIINDPIYRMEDIERVERYFNSQDKVSGERTFAYEFMYAYFGEKLVGYCASPCQQRIHDKLEHAKLKVLRYEEFKRQTKKNP